jgi:branched-chain amino acid transport system ATP-binding protein
MLRIDDVSVRFGGLKAVDSVQLEIGNSEMVGLVGPNGAGKTTLFNVVSGLVSPTSGRVLFDHHDVTRLPLHRRARLGIGRTFQIPQPLHDLTVEENLMVAQRFGGRGVNKKRLHEILELTNLSAKAGADAASQLAVTELRLLEVAKAIATEPRLLLLDEVLAGLETFGKRHFVELLRQLHSALDLTVVVIEHDIETIRQLCSRVVVLDHGTIIADGTPTAVFNDAAVIKSYTGGAHA